MANDCECKLCEYDYDAILETEHQMNWIQRDFIIGFHGNIN